MAASFAASLAGSHSASADSSCIPLLEKLWAWYSTPGIFSVYFSWSTHLQTSSSPSGDYLSGHVGYTRFQLSRKSDYLSFEGAGDRVWSFQENVSISSSLRGIPRQPFDVGQPESVTFEIIGPKNIPRIRTNPTIILGNHGPFEIKCEGDKFLYVYTGDTFETFSFGFYKTAER